MRLRRSSMPLQRWRWTRPATSTSRTWLNHRIRRVSATTGIISTFAGTGIAGYSGDGGTATSARLNTPFGVAVDGAGNVYIADWLNQRVRQVSAATGTISTIAGTGIAGYSGDGPPRLLRRSSAILKGLAVDAAGNVYIADRGNHRIRKVSASGVISTITGSVGGAFGGDGGAATSAMIFSPTGVAVDGSGNVYIADWRKPTHPQGVDDRHHLHHRGIGRVRVRRGWRPGHRSAARQPVWGCGGRNRPSLHRRQPHPPGPRDETAPPRSRPP